MGIWDREMNLLSEYYCRLCNGMYEYINQSNNNKKGNKIQHKEKVVQRFKECSVAQRTVIDARSKKIPDEHLSMILGIAAKQWTPDERQKWDSVIRELVTELGESEEKIYTIDQAVMLLASRQPVDIAKPLYHVNETSAEVDVAQDIAKITGGTMKYNGPVGEEITGVNGTIREEMQEGDDSELMWVLKRDESVRVHKRNMGVRTPHPTLVGGDDPVVISGGTITSSMGRIQEIRDDSGHFRPRIEGVPYALKWIHEHELPLDDEYRGFITHGTEKGTLGYGGTFLAQWKDIKESLHDKIGKDLIERINTRIIGWNQYINHADEKVFLTEVMLRRISSNLLEPMLEELYDLNDILKYRRVEEQAKAINIWKAVYGIIEQYIDKFRIGMELEDAIELLELIEDNLRILDVVVSH